MKAFVEFPGGVLVNGLLNKQVNRKRNLVFIYFYEFVVEILEFNRINKARKTCSFCSHVNSAMSISAPKFVLNEYNYSIFNLSNSNKFTI